MCVCDFIIAQHYNNHKGVIYIAMDTEIKVFHLKISIFSYYNLLKKELHKMSLFFYHCMSV